MLRGRGVYRAAKRVRFMGDFFFERIRRSKTVILCVRREANAGRTPRRSAAVTAQALRSSHSTWPPASRTCSPSSKHSSAPHTPHPAPRSIPVRRPPAFPLRGRCCPQAADEVSVSPLSPRFLRHTRPPASRTCSSSRKHSSAPHTPHPAPRSIPVRRPQPSP